MAARNLDPCARCGGVMCDCTVAETDEMAKAAITGKRHRKRLTRRIMDATGNEWGGSASPPLSNRSIYVKDDGVYRVFSMVDDGGFVGIGYPDQWHVIMRTKAARMFAWWTFKVWLADWCGLRSWAYYVALHAHVDHKWKLRPYKEAHKRTRRMTHLSSHDEWRKDPRK